MICFLMAENDYLLRPIGVIESQLKTLNDCPKQGNEGAPDGWLIIDPALADGLDGLVVGTRSGSRLLITAPLALPLWEAPRNCDFGLTPGTTLQPRVRDRHAGAIPKP
jgi:hypothetical protein